MTNTTKVLVTGASGTLGSAVLRGTSCFVSIIGIDRVPLRYYKLKVETEAVIRSGGVPFTILRAAQFPTLVDSMLSGLSEVRGGALTTKALPTGTRTWRDYLEAKY